jgi:hypothetical protein
MKLRPTPDTSIEALRSADRLARAASRWLRREQPPGATFPAAGPEHRDLLAGLVTGLGEWLAVDKATQLLAAYALAMLEHERDGAVDTPARIGALSPLTPDYIEGLRIAERLAAALAEGNVAPQP